jgi:NNP family nitrate/nitrite transporter-like MFS transporter
MLMFVIVAAALAWMHFAIRSAEKAEWTAQETKTDLPELASPNLFYPLNRVSPKDPQVVSGHPPLQQ